MSGGTFTAVCRKPSKNTKLKYRPGRLIKSPNMLYNAIKAGKWIYLRGRPKSPGWIVSMQLATLMSFIQNKGLRIAELNRNKQSESGGSK